MKNTFLLLIFVLFAQSAVLAQDTEKEILMKAARKEVQTLCSPKFAGRGYLENGHKKAADYLSKRFSAIGLKPVKTTKNYQQSFPMEINLVQNAVIQIDGKKLVEGVDFITHEATAGTSGTAEIIDIDYALTIPENLAGKAVIFTDGLPDSIANDAKKKELYKEAGSLMKKIEKISAQKPAILILRKNKLTFSFENSQMPFAFIQILSEKYPKNSKQIQWEIKAGMTKFNSQNVLGMVTGKSVKDSFIVVSAHYDHLGKLGKAIFTGANDNASGTTMLLSVAEYFVKNPPKYSVLFIAFGGEETGLNGSEYYVKQNPIIPLPQMRFLLNLDLMGNGVDGIMAVGGVDFPNEFSKLKTLNDSLQAVPIVKQRKNAPNSDHYFFLQQGVKGFFIYTMGGPTFYHDVYDTPENLQFSKYVEVRKLLIRFLESL
jgi:aminopeptidase YwaD